MTGANGTGKSSLYRSLRLLADSASEPVSLRLGFAGDEFGYAVDFGHPVPVAGSLFALDPEIKRECTWAGPVLRPAALLCDRAGPAVRTRTAAGGRHRTQNALRPYDSMLSELADPQLAPDLLALRELMRSWRFYGHVRTDAGAPGTARCARRARPNCPTAPCATCSGRRPC
ncbi:AAA family ATPase [Streptomyces virginiae]|uniref:AAA family ATPase n=1 Tax=Streptomyces virginiae TaxID=1961 RepID=UPI0036460C56